MSQLWSERPFITLPTQQPKVEIPTNYTGYQVNNKLFDTEFDMVSWLEANKKAGGEYTSQQWVNGSVKAAQHIHVDNKGRLISNVRTEKAL